MLVGSVHAQNHPSIEELQNNTDRFHIFIGHTLWEYGTQVVSDWTNTDYWLNGSLPTENDTVVIASGAICRIFDMDDSTASSLRNLPR